MKRRARERRPWIRLILSLAGLVSSGAAHATPPVVEAIATTPSPFIAAGQSVEMDLQIQNNSDAVQQLSEIQISIEHPGGYTHPLWTSDDAPILQPHASVRIDQRLTWPAPPALADGAYFIVARITDTNGHTTRVDAGFVRLMRGPLPPPTYTIDREQYKGMDVFKLRGGMSAEYAVQKALANLAAGVSHSWYTQAPGRGPDRVYASPQFMEESIRRTVAYYDDYLGADRVYDTVILSTGVATVPYLSRVTQAPVLPLHFLVSAGSVREVRAVLDHSRHNGTAAYAVLGYDASMPDLGVAWIKLLELPEEYRQFLQRHKTRRVLVAGTTGTFGETLARRIVDRRPGAAGDPTGSEDVYLLYTSASALPFPGQMAAAAVYAADAFAGDLRQMETRISDLHHVPLAEGFVRIADWESGISPAQLDGLATGLQSMGIEPTLLSVEPQNDEVAHLYDLAAHLVREFYLKNGDRIAAGRRDRRLVRGVAVNPYMISQPFYESRQGYLPLLFWQGNDAGTLATHTQKLITNCLAGLPGNPSPAALHYWVNVTRNFNFFLYPAGTYVEKLRARIGSDLSIEVGTAETDEVWDPTDGINASCERVAETMLQAYTAADLRRWEASLKPLTIDDLRQVQARYGRMVLRPLAPAASTPPATVK